ncbi:MAG: GntR family transcriptional regulator [Armatimonadota bacterium]
MRLDIPALSLISVDQAVYQTIAEQIITGALPPGTRITEEGIAAQLGVSRTPVREAMKALAKDELVELLPRRGAYVRQLSKDDFEEIYELREALEGMAARLAATRVACEDLEELTEQIEICKQEIAHGQTERCLEFDAALHCLIMARCGNERLCKTLKSINNLVHYFRSGVARDSRRIADAFTEHCKLLTALEQRDPDMAEAVARNHVKTSRERTLIDIHFGLSQKEKKNRP